MADDQANAQDPAECSNADPVLIWANGALARATSLDDASVRAVLAEVCLREYHRLAGEAAAVAHDATRAQILRRRASVWRTTAGCIRGVTSARWPEWVLARVQNSEALPHVGAEYARQRVLLERCIGVAAIGRTTA